MLRVDPMAGGGDDDRSMHTDVLAPPASATRRRTRRWAAGIVATVTVAVLAVAGVTALNAVQTAPHGGIPQITDPGRLTDLMATRVNNALSAAARAGVPLEVTSGYRSAAYQQGLFDQAIKRYGSREAATHWVLPPQDSAHVRGLAVDVGPEAGMAWLEANGAKFGLCRRYDNEPWHFEPLVDPGGTCPPREPYAVATH